MRKPLVQIHKGLQVFIVRVMLSACAAIALGLAGCNGSSNNIIISPTASPTATTPASPTATPTTSPTATPTATPTPSESLSGTAVQGAMTGSAIAVYVIDTSDGSNGAILGTATTAADGTFTVHILPQTGPVRLTASAGSYASEMNGATISSPATISNVLLSARSTVTGLSINPLSDFVNSRAIALLADHATDFDTAVTKAAAMIEKYYGLSADPGTIVPNYTKAGIGTDAGNLGLILGAIINEDQTLCPASPGSLVTALSADISDGLFDGKASGKPIPYCGGDLPAIAGISFFQDALSGLEQSTTVPGPFAFGGTGNILTSNGLANLALAETPAQIYPLPPLSAINVAVLQAAPAAVNTLAPASDTATMNVAREQAMQAVLPNGKVLIAGGISATGDLTSTELYDPATNTFAPPAGTATMNVARDSASIIVLPNGKVLIAGGFNGTVAQAVASTELYDPATNTFAPAAEIATMNAARYLATATLRPDGKVLVAGGYDVNGNALASTELFDPTTNSFAPASATATMNVARAEAMAVRLLNGSVLIAGGYNTADAELASTELYDPTTNSFAPISGTATMNSPHDYGTATLLPNGKVLIAGGYTNFDEITATTELYDTATNTFASEPGTAFMNDARAEDVAVLLPNGNVFIGRMERRRGGHYGAL